jgi:rhodanese-related sulfurtransferase
MSYRELPIAEFEQSMAAGGQLVDVREPGEVARGTLPGAVNIPLRSLAERVGELDPNRPVVLLCRSGARSGHAGRWLSNSGFSDVVNLTGGMLAYETLISSTS